MKVETNKVRKQLDVSVITAQTISGLFAYLELNEDDTEYDVNKKLNNAIARKQSVNRKSKNDGGSAIGDT